MTFDAYELCSPELQQRLKPVRDKFEAIEEAEAEARMSGKLKIDKSKRNGNVMEENEETKEYERYDFPEGNLNLIFKHVMDLSLLLISCK